MRVYRCANPWYTSRGLKDNDVQYTHWIKYATNIKILLLGFTIAEMYVNSKYMLWFDNTGSNIQPDGVSSQCVNQLESYAFILSTASNHFGNLSEDVPFLFDPSSSSNTTILLVLKTRCSYLWMKLLTLKGTTVTTVTTDWHQEQYTAMKWYSENRSQIEWEFRYWCVNRGLFWRSMCHCWSNYNYCYYGYKLLMISEGITRSFF